MPQLPTTARDASYENPSLGVCLLTYRSCPPHAPTAAAPGTSEWDRERRPVILVELRLQMPERNAERPPSRMPLKLSAPWSPGRPATSSNVAVLVTVSACNQDGSMTGASTARSDWATALSVSDAAVAQASRAATGRCFIATSCPHPL